MYRVQKKTCAGKTFCVLNLEINMRQKNKK